MAAVPIAIRLEQRVIDDIDVLVLDHEALNRTDFIKTAIAEALERSRQRRIDRQLIEAYERMPLTDEELADIDASSRRWAADLDGEDW
jgi:Arc/MetJ-type ribon-helix-helix transcriptional regulator